MAIREQWGWLMEMPAVWFDKSFFQLPVTLAAVHNTSVFIKKYSFHPSPLPPPYSLSAWMKHRSHVINKCCKCRHLMTGCQGNSVGRCHWGSRRSVSWLHSCWTCWHVHSNALLHAYETPGCTCGGHLLCFIAWSLVFCLLHVFCTPTLFSAVFTPSVAEVSPSSRPSLHIFTRSLSCFFFSPWFHCVICFTHTHTSEKCKYAHAIAARKTRSSAVVSLRQLKVTRTKRRESCCWKKEEQKTQRRRKR